MTKPLTLAQRLDRYRAQRQLNTDLTPKQRRRLLKKHHPDAVLWQKAEAVR